MPEDFTGDNWKQHDHPDSMPIGEREQWHRDQWDREQDALLAATRGAAGNDAPGRVSSFGYASPSVAHEER